MWNKLKGWKTVGFNALAIAHAFGAHYGVLPTIDPSMVATIVAVINLALRFRTSTPVFENR